MVQKKCEARHCCDKKMNEILEGSTQTCSGVGCTYSLHSVMVMWSGLVLCLPTVFKENGRKFNIYIMTCTIANCVRSCQFSEVYKEHVFRQHAFQLHVWNIVWVRDYVMHNTDKCSQHNLKNTPVLLFMFCFLLKFFYRPLCNVILKRQCIALWNVNITAIVRQTLIFCALFTHAY